MATRVLSASLVRSFIQGPDSKTTYLFQAITLGRGDGTEFADGKGKHCLLNSQAGTSYNPSPKSSGTGILVCWAPLLNNVIQ